MSNLYSYSNWSIYGVNELIFSLNRRRSLCFEYPRNKLWKRAPHSSSPLKSTVIVTNLCYEWIQCSLNGPCFDLDIFRIVFRPVHMRTHDGRESIYKMNANAPIQMNAPLWIRKKWLWHFESREREREKERTSMSIEGKKSFSSLDLLQSTNKHVKRKQNTSSLLHQSEFNCLCSCIGR